jgi:hypothetical protein
LIEAREFRAQPSPAFLRLQPQLFDIPTTIEADERGRTTSFVSAARRRSTGL